jgi:hypothetical protein
LVSLEQKFHDYIYNREVKLRLSDLTSLRQKYTETVSDYLRRFGEVINHCYNLTIAEKDLANLVFPGLAPYLRDKMDGQEFFDTNQLLQCVLLHENTQRTGEPQRRTVHDSIDRESGIRQNPQFTDRSGSSNPDRRVNHLDVLRNGEESSRRPKQTKEHVAMVGSWPCRVSSKIDVNG